MLRFRSNGSVKSLEGVNLQFFPLKKWPLNQYFTESSSDGFEGIE